MNHFLGLAIISVSIAAVFALIMKEGTEERVRYFLILLAYLVGGSLVAAWVMYPFPW